MDDRMSEEDRQEFGPNGMPEMHVVIRHGKGEASTYLPNSAGFATLAQIEAMNKAAIGTGFGYVSLQTVFAERTDLLSRLSSLEGALREYDAAVHRFMGARWIQSFESGADADEGVDEEIFFGAYWEAQILLKDHDELIKTIPAKGGPSASEGK